MLSFDALGVVDPRFAPVLDGPVGAVLPGPVDGTVYVGGAFRTLGGAAVPRLLLLDLATGAQVPGFRAPVLSGTVEDLARVGGRLYVGGSFTRVSGVAHAGLVSLDARTGALDPYVGVQVAGHATWTPDAPAGTAKGVVGVRRLDVDAAGTRLVAVGNFATVGGLDHQQVVQLDLTGPAAKVLDWATERYDTPCLAGAYDSSVRDVASPPTARSSSSPRAAATPAPARSATRRRAGRPGPRAAGSSPPGSTGRAATRCCRSRSAPRPCTSAATSAGSTTPTARTPPGPARCPAPASAPSTPRPACRSPGTPAATRAASAPARCC